jgi:alpha-L-rhamnosidase
MTSETPPGREEISRRRLLAGGAAGALSLAAARGPLPRAAASTEAAGPGSAVLVSAAQPTGLLTSLLDDPLGVPVTGLRMSWIVPALGAGPMQSAYQIQLAASPAGFASPHELVWDSGQVNDTASTAVRYTGPDLQPSTPYWWRVRTWGARASAWSVPQRMVTEAAQWTGTPVWAPADAAESRDWALLRTEFTLPDKPVLSAFVQATAASPEGARQYVYKLWCNGTVAGRGPVRSMGTEARYHTHDVTTLLRPGPNALAALCYTASGHQFQAQAIVVFEDGSRQVTGTSGSWRALRGAKMLPSAGFTGGGYFNAPQEYWDMRQEPSGWTQPGFDDSAWPSATVGAAFSSLAPAMVNVEQYLIEPASVTQVVPGQWLVDLGREIAGGLRLRVSGTAGDTITVQLGEQLDGTSVVYRLLAGSTYSEVWTLRDGVQEIEHWGYRGFRWAQLTASDTSLDLSQAVHGVALHMAWHEDDSAFDCSDPGLTRVWQFARYSIQATSLDVYQDTPTRERGPYEGDALVMQRSQYAVQRSYGLARYSNSYLCRRPTWPAEYHLMPVLSAWADYLATGDPGHFTADYPFYVAKNFDSDLGGDNLVHKAPGSSSQNNADLVDWPPAERDGYVFTDVNTVINSFQYAAYATLAKVAAVLGKAADQAKYTGLADQVRTAINTLLLPAGAGAYLDGEGTTHTALHATFFPVALGVAQDADLPALGAFLAAGGMACSVYAAQFLLDALFAAGQADAAHALLTATGLSSWLHMMDDLHATITMEAWDPSVKPNTTFSHPWGSAPASVVPRHILGVQVTAPGAAELLVRPQPGPLTWMRGTVPTIRGPVTVSVDRREGLHAVVGFPPNTTGQIEIDTAALAVTQDSLRITSPRGSRPAITTDGAVVVVAGVRPGQTVITAT